jgi:hypothetical protein
MIDFLDRLAARSVSNEPMTNPVITPRPLSRFENEPDVPLLETTTETAAPVPTRRAQAPDDPGTPQMKSVPYTQSDPRPSVPQTPVTASNVHDFSFNIPPVVSEQQPAAPQPSITHADTAPVESHTIHSITHEHHTETVVPRIEREIHTHSEILPRVEREIRTETLVPRIEREIHTRSEIVPRVERPEREQESMPRLVAQPLPTEIRREVVQGDIRPAEPDIRVERVPDASVSAVPTGDAAPTVHISIGRIEVRAQRGTSQTPSARTTRELGSDLAAYLRERGGKGKRE